MGNKYLLALVVFKLVNGIIIIDEKFLHANLMLFGHDKIIYFLSTCIIDFCTKFIKNELKVTMI